MRSSILIPLVAASFGVAQNVNSTYVTGLVNALNGWGLTSLTSGLTSLSSDPTTQALLARLPNGTRTIFAPNNAALAAAGGAPFNGSTLAYHILSGTFTANNIAKDPAHTIGRTFLNGSLVQLEGNEPQVLALQGSNTTLFACNQPNTTSILESNVYQNLVVHTIDNVLVIPQTPAVLLGLSNFSSLASVAGPALPAIEAAHGITIFAPTNDAFTAAQSSLGGANSSTVTNILENHIINGTALYSSEFGSGTHVSNGGQQLTFNTNSSGTFVTSGPSTAQVITSDVLMSNGVVHVINGVLLNSNFNPTAASSAYAAATSSAGTSGVAPTNTGPIAGSGGNNGGHNGAIGVNPVSALFAFVGVAAGALFVL
ncbi:hypothetical protein BOTBODRAFT_155520 [Botryobasidium botryosum FD-172 SS1]|uniref:FAS1 domain-containing protein n=1 Tax=Botryobasidium botryosum (strain FD-172 SS1) TaxID=930990 RepID=A0A067MPM4_BOTB1|nr:hypothetical protein BOTBODRAFT_155520 [Botryobasidium botryosum FD-172 SS1]